MATEVPKAPVGDRPAVPMAAAILLIKGGTVVGAVAFVMSVAIVATAPMA